MRYPSLVDVLHLEDRKKMDAEKKRCAAMGEVARFGRDRPDAIPVAMSSISQGQHRDFFLLRPLVDSGPAERRGEALCVISQYGLALRFSCEFFNDF